MNRLSEYGVRSVEELDTKEWGNYFLSKDISGLKTPPDEAAKKLYEDVNLIDQYVRQMNRVRDEHRVETQRSLASLRDKRRNEKLFEGRFKQLVRKPEFKSRVCETQQFSATTPLNFGPHMDPWEKLALITPSRIFEKELKWKPNDDKHVYFEDSLSAAPSKQSLRRLPNRIKKA